MGNRAVSLQILLAALVPLLVAAPAAAVPGAQSAAPRGDGWSGQANLNLAGTYGNAGSGSLGVSAETVRATDRLRVVVEGGLLRTTTATITRQAFGSLDAFSVERSVTSRTSADRSHLRARISEPFPRDGVVGPRFFAAAGWERDAPAGIRSRFDLTVGVRTTWGAAGSQGRRRFEVGAGLAAGHQSDEVADPEAPAASLGSMPARQPATGGPT